MRSWSSLLQDNSVRRISTSRKEISDRIDCARLSFNDSLNETRSDTGKYKDLYDTAFQWCFIVLRAEGWRTQSGGHHEAVFSAFRHFLGDPVDNLAAFLDECRSKRHELHYDWTPTTVSEVEATELETAVKELEVIVLEWLRSHHPEYLSG